MKIKTQRPDRPYGHGMADHPAAKPRHGAGQPANPRKPTGPFIIPPDLTRQELMFRLVGGRKIAGFTTEGIKGYCKTQDEQLQPWHIPTREQVKTWLAQAGYDPTLADKHEAGYTKEQLAAARERLKRASTTIPD